MPGVTAPLPPTEPPTEAFVAVQQVTDPRRPRRWPLVAALVAVVGLAMALLVVLVGRTEQSPATGLSTPTQQYIAAVRTVSDEASTRFDDAMLIELGNSICNQPAGTVRATLIEDFMRFRSISRGAAETVVSTAVQHLCPTRTWTPAYQAAAPTTTSRPISTDPNAVETYVVSSAREQIYVDSLSDLPLTAAEAKAVAPVICAAYGGGATFIQMVGELKRALPQLTAFQVGELNGAAVAVYCPQFSRSAR